MLRAVINLLACWEGFLIVVVMVKFGRILMCMIWCLWRERNAGFLERCESPLAMLNIFFLLEVSL